MKKSLPKYLFDALTCIYNHQGDNMDFVFYHMNIGTARSYVSKLKRKGLAYTYKSGSDVEVWLTDKGMKLIKDNHVQ